MQIIFQDPYSTLNPRMTVGEAIAEPIRIHNIVKKSEVMNRVAELLTDVGIDPQYQSRYPHEFSGGQRQRICIARTLACEPEFIVCDEAISALDVSIQAQIINLLMDLQKKYNLTYFFIAHDLAVVRHVSTRVAVVYLGKIVEIGDTEQIYQHPIHPYTKALLNAVPIADPEIERNRDVQILLDDLPSPINPPSGCHFHTRCAYATEECKITEPDIKIMGVKHWVACHHAAELK